jgi:hypothetical protein
MTGTLHDDQLEYCVICRSLFLRIKNTSDEHCRENQNTFCVQLHFFENGAVYEIMWKDIV